MVSYYMMLLLICIINVKMGLREKVAKNIRKKRLELWISQESLAVSSGLHRTYMGLIERGVANISIDVLEKVAKALNVQPRELL